MFVSYTLNLNRRVEKTVINLPNSPTQAETEGGTSVSRSAPEPRPCIPSRDCSTTATDGTIDGATDATTNGAADGAIDGATDGTTDGTTYDTADGTTDGNTDGR